MPATRAQLAAQRACMNACTRARVAARGASAASALGAGPERDAALRDALRDGAAARMEFGAAQRQLLRDTGGFELLDRTLPVLLLPVRLEVRLAWPDPDGGWVFREPWQDTGRHLLVRIVPDQVHVDDLARGLTEQEAGAAARFQRAVRAPGFVAAMAAWQQLAADVGPGRAPWVARQDLAAAPQRPQGWSQQSFARLLPDQWRVSVTMRGGVAQAVTRPAPESVPMTVDPMAPDPAQVAWISDFSAAVAIGLGIAVPLVGPNGAPLVGRVVEVTAVGAVARLDPEAGQATFLDLIEAHHASAGVRVAAPGDPTTSSVAGRAVTARRAELTRETVEAERERGEGVSERDPHDLQRSMADRLARALGTNRLPWRVIPGVQSSRAIGVEAALRHVTVAAFGPMLAELVSSAALPRILTDYQDRLTAAGPLPVLLVRDQPYGLVPVLPLIGRPGSDAAMAAVERVREAWWEPAVERVPRLGRIGRDSLADLTALLSRDGAPHRFQLRVGVLGALVTAATAGRDLTDPSTTLADGFGPGTNAVAPDWAAGLMHLLLAPGATPVRDPITIVDLRAGGGPLLTPDQYLRDLSLAPLDALATGTPGIPDGVPAPLLYQLARAAMLAVLDTAIRDALAAADRAGGLPERSTPLSEGENEYLWTVAERGARVLSWAPLATTALDLLKAQATPELLIVAGHVGNLASAPADLLDVLTRQVLDLPARIDPWYTAAAWDRLDRLRESTDPALPGKRGLHIGGYGVLRQFPSGGPGDDAGGYVHTPGAAHAVTAAVLHSAHRQRRRDAAGLPAAEAAAVQASTSLRLDGEGLRAAMDLLDGLRAGQPLAELLGEELERRLVDREQQVLLAPLRAAFPTAAGPSAPGAVVDGLGVVTAAGFPGPVTALPVPVQQGQDDLMDCITAVAGVVDALGDLLLADGVHGLTQGRFTTAAALADFAAGARRSVPEPELPRTDQLGTTDQVRVLVALPAVDEAAQAWPSSARSLAAPELALWAQTVLPSPGEVALWCRLPADGPEPEESRLLRLADLLSDDAGNLLSPSQEVAAFGVLDLAAAAGMGTGPDTPLRARLDRLATLQVGRRAVAEPERDDGLAPGDLPMSALIAAARRLARTLASVRAVVPGDLARTAAAVPSGSVDELVARAGTAVAALTAAADALAAVDMDGVDVNALDTAQLASLLFAAELAGIGIAVPNSAAGLRVAVGAAAAESARRAAASPGPLPAGASDEERVAWSAELLTHIFGTGLPATARLQLPLTGPAVPAARGWLGQAASTRPHVRSLLLTELTAAASGRPSTVHAVRTSGGPWTLEPGPAGSIDLVIVTALPGSDLTRPVHTLAVDEWTRTVPATYTDTALTFYQPTPSASAPQALLLAVPPVWLEEWTADALEQVVSEALHLARLRSVDLADVGANQLLPPLLSSSEPPGARPSRQSVDGLAPDGLVGYTRS